MPDRHTESAFYASARKLKGDVDPQRELRNRVSCIRVPARPSEESRSVDYGGTKGYSLVNPTYLAESDPCSRVFERNTPRRFLAGACQVVVVGPYSLALTGCVRPERRI
jgi:hypothetical protein